MPILGGAVMIGTPEQYRERMKRLKPKAFVGGEEIKDLLTDPNTKPIVNTVVFGSK